MATRKPTPIATEEKSNVTWSVDMVRDKETKNTYRFQAEDEDSPLQTVYIRKEAFPNGIPDYLELTVKTVE